MAHECRFSPQPLEATKVLVFFHRDYHCLFINLYMLKPWTIYSCVGLLPPSVILKSVCIFAYISSSFFLLLNKDFMGEYTGVYLSIFLVMDTCLFLLWAVRNKAAVSLAVKPFCRTQDFKAQQFQAIWFQNSHAFPAPRCFSAVHPIALHFCGMCL